MQRLQHLLRSSPQQLVKDVEVSLSLLLFDDPGLLQEVIIDVPPCGIPLEVKIDVHVLAESTGIVISVRLGVTESFHDLVGPDQHGGHPGDENTK